MSTSWLSLIPVCAPFAYRGDMICADCAKQVISKLEENDVGDTGDTNDFPQDGSNEADSPQHCGYGDKCVNAVKIPNGKKIGCPLNTYLTPDGINWTRGKIAEHVLFGSDHQKAISRLWWSLYKISVNSDCLIQLTRNAGVPKPLKNALSPLLNSKSTNILNDIYTDLEYVYGGAIWGSAKDRLTLWRIHISDTGEFTNVDQVLLPADILLGEPLDVMISNAISESAWE